MTREKVPGLIGVVVNLEPVVNDDGTATEEGFGRDFAGIDDALGNLRDLIPTLGSWRFITLLNGHPAGELIAAGPPPPPELAELKVAALEELVDAALDALLAIAEHHPETNTAVPAATADRMERAKARLVELETFEEEPRRRRLGAADECGYCRMATTHLRAASGNPELRSACTQHATTGDGTPWLAGLEVLDA